MRLRNLIITMFCVALAVPAFAGAQQESEYKVTGGGQVIADEEGFTGPGDTVAFVAQATGAAPQGEEVPAKGQFQAVETSEGGSGMEIYHGSVTCIVSGGDTAARFGGEMRDPRSGSTETLSFTVDVTDADADDSAEDDDDTVVFRITGGPCEDEGTDVFENTMLARGNLTIHTADE